MKSIFIMMAMVMAALAADVTGEWKATAEGPNGSMELTFSLKADGAKLTGETVSSFAGKSTIREGKIDGNNLSFLITVKIQDNGMELKYQGKILSKDGIKFTAEGFQWQAIEWLAKRK